MGLNLVTLVGSVRFDRQGIKAARFVERSLRDRGHDVTLVDPVEAWLPLLDRMYQEKAMGESDGSEQSSCGWPPRGMVPARKSHERVRLASSGTRWTVFQHFRPIQSASPRNQPPAVQRPSMKTALDLTADSRSAFNSLYSSEAYHSCARSILGNSMRTGNVGRH